MTQTKEFTAQFLENYGTSWGGVKADFSRCAAMVDTTPGERFSSYAQCSRKNGHGPHGAWCKQHNPDAVKERAEARRKKWRAEWDEQSRKATFAKRCQEAIRQIAAGHNDPRGLAQSLIDALNEGIEDGIK